MVSAQMLIAFLVSGVHVKFEVICVGVDVCVVTSLSMQHVVCDRQIYNTSSLYHFFILNHKDLQNDKMPIYLKNPYI